MDTKHGLAGPDERLFELYDEVTRAGLERPAILKAGEEALRRLLPVAQGNSGQCRVVAGFLLGLYNGQRFRFDLTDLRLLDRQVFEDCLTVLRMDYAPAREVHSYFPNGSEIFERLVQDWRLDKRES